MGAIKDIVDLTSQLAKSVKDREIASKLFEIQSLISQLHAENTELQTEKLNLVKQLHKLEMENERLKHDIASKKNQNIPELHFHNNLLWSKGDPVPFCPRCHEADNKQIHMKHFKLAGMQDHFRCTACTHNAALCKNPILENP